MTGDLYIYNKLIDGYLYTLSINNQYKHIYKYEGIYSSTSSLYKENYDFYTDFFQEVV